MKINGILNSEICKVLADMGHTDELCISDCGLPIPKNVKKIDLALQVGKPSFIEVLKVLVKEMKIEKVTLASEIVSFNEWVLDEIKNLIGDIQVDFVSHKEFKEMTKNSKCIIRTGEATPYANIILTSGVIF